MQVGALTAFMQYLSQILFAVLTAVFMFILIPRATVSARRIQEVLLTEPAITDPAEPVTPTPIGRPGLVEFHDVEFGYPGAEEPVLHAISFVARPGETTAIIGSTGSGKTTLINLIPRLYDVTGGSVTVDGVDVRAMAREDLWARIGFIPQKAFLFRRDRRQQPPLRRPGRHRRAALGRARRSPRAVISSRRWRAGSRRRSPRAGATCPAGSASGSRSPGRWSSARRSSSSTTASRRWTSRPMRGCAPPLSKSLGNATVIIVAQRVGTIMKADRIVVLDAGRVVGIGTHPELLATNETYQEIVYSQLSTEEAAG